MSQTFVEDTRVPVTLIKAGPCIVTQIKKLDPDGYWAVQIGFGQRKIKNVTKPLLGHLKGALQENKAPRFLREVRLEKEPEFKVGDTIRVSEIFKRGDVVSVSGTSKGKGFAGVVKRYHFAGGPKTHGQSDRQRAPGSIGQGTTPGRVLKGKKMAGRMGHEKVTIKNLIVVDIDSEKNELLVSGTVPGPITGLLTIKKLKSGSLEELVEETPQVEIQQVEEETEPGKQEETQGKAEEPSSASASEGKKEGQ